MTPEEYEDLLITIAGEIDPRYSPYGTPENRAEIAQIAQVIKNRARSRGGNMSDQIKAPSQFSYRFVPGGMATARGNLAKYGDDIRSAVNDWEFGLNEAPLPTADHYYNPSIVNPGWARNLDHGGSIGPHAFGTDPAAMGGIQAGLVDDIAAQAGGYPTPSTPETQMAEADPGVMDYLSSMFVTPAHAAEQPWVSGVDRAPAVTRGGRLPENREGDPFMLQPGMLAEPLPPAEVVPSAPAVYEAPFDPSVDIEDRPMVGAPMVQDFDHGGASDYTPPTQSQRQQNAGTTASQPPPSINPGMMAPINQLLQTSLGMPTLADLLRGQPAALGNRAVMPSGIHAVNQNSGLYSSLMQNSPQFAGAMASGGLGLY